MTEQLWPKVLNIIEDGSQNYLFKPEELVYSTCWRAREILGAYMLGSQRVETERYIKPQEGLPSDEEFPPKSNPEDLRFPILHQTNKVRLDFKYLLNLSNRPFLVGEDRLLHPYTQPGYVAMHFTSGPEVHPDYPPIKSTSDQLIFRMPHMAETQDKESHYYGYDVEEAIFHGFELSENSRIDDDPNKVLKARKILEFYGILIRRVLTMNSRILDYTYLSTTPDRPLEHEIINFIDSESNED